MTSSSHGRSRASFLAAPPLTETEAAEGSAILMEVPGPVGVLLWETCRDLMAWVKTSPQRRARLFSERAWQKRTDEIARAVHPKRLRDVLFTLAGILMDPAPVEFEQVTEACEAVSGWAEEFGHPVTRLSFTQVAALIDPFNARLALETGRQARDLAEYARGETWFRQAIQIARRSKDWQTYLACYGGLAMLYEKLGNYPASRAVTGRVLKTARHYRVRSMEGLAFHQFFVLDAQDGNTRAVYENVRAALQAHGSESPKVVILAHDLARFWIESGYFSRALSIFNEALLPRITNAEERAMAAANIAWAAAGAGKPEMYEQARLQAISTIAQVPWQARSPEVHASLAFAAANVGDWTIAEETAELALQSAAQRRNPDAWGFAKDAMNFAQARRAQPVKHDEGPTLARQADRLADELIQLLG